MKKIFIPLTLFVLISACVATLPPVSPQQVERVRSKWPDITSAQIEAGRVLYIDRCSSCHNLYLPQQRSLEQWEVVLDTMAPRAKLSDEQKQSIWKYLVVVKTDN